MASSFAPSPQESAGQSAADAPAPSYPRVFLTFLQNSLVREMTFRANFVIEVVTSLLWMGLNLGFYLLIFTFTQAIGDWGKFEFLAFLATSLFVNSIVQIFFMLNMEEFSELVRTGGLDFALQRPIDTQFLVSLRRIDLSGVAEFLFAIVLLAYALFHLEHTPTPVQMLLYPLYVLCGVAILYSLMITLAATSVWLGRNQTLYEFWFYITNFSRYPMEIYDGPIGSPLRFVFTFIVPLLIVVNVPADLVAWPLVSQSWPLAGFALLAAAACLAGSRLVFQAALRSYRSASS